MIRRALATFTVSLAVVTAFAQSTDKSCVSSTAKKPSAAITSSKVKPAVNTHDLSVDCANAVTTASDTVNVARARRIMGLPLACLAGLGQTVARTVAPLALVKWTTRGYRDAVLRSRTGRRLGLHMPGLAEEGRLHRNSSQRSPASNRSTWR